MSKTIDELKALANQVKNATLPGENTAERIGGLFEDIVEYTNSNEEVLRFDKIIIEELSHIGATTDKTPNAIVYVSFYKRFLAIVGTGDSAAYFYTWPGYEKYTDTANNNNPYDNKVYLCNGSTYTWDGANLVGSGSDEQIQSDWNQNDSSKKDYIKNKPTIPDSAVLEDIADNMQSLTEMSEDMLYVDSNPPVLPTQTEYDYDVYFEVTEDEEPTVMIDGRKTIYYSSNSDDSRISESEAFAKDGQGNYIHNPHEEGWYERFETPIPGSEHEVSVSWKIGTIFYTIGNRTIGVKTLTDFKTYYVARKEVHSGDSLLDDIKFTHTVSSAEAVHLSLEKQTISTTESQNLTDEQKAQAQNNIGVRKGVANGVASLNVNGVVPTEQLPDEVKKNFATETDIRALFH